MLIDENLVNDFEIVVGFVAPIGTDLQSVTEWLTEELRVYGYGSDVIRLSRLLDTGQGQESAGYYESRMDAGDAQREQAGSGDAVAALAIAKILQSRGNESRERRFAWVLRTLKHDEEVRLLRQVFGRRFILIGVHQSKSKRKQSLTNSLKDETPQSSDLNAAVESLISRDQFDSTNPLGQRVRETFSMSDYFIDLNDDPSKEVSRMVGLLFAEPFHSPTRDEAAMFHAHGASLRSADPGRQVGAVITTKGGDIIAVGSNEVPRHGGGEYWYGDEDDSRDFRQGFDFNKRESRRVLMELLNTLADRGHLSASLEEANPEERLRQLWSSDSAALKKTRVMSLIEFGRVVHAEMSALMQAARSTVTVKDAVLYTTAFPCHMCMRLVIASGIDRVVYVDPYPKSLAFEMYGDSISDDVLVSDRVRIDAFSGVGWGVFPYLFEGVNRDRDESGNFNSFDKLGARYRMGEPDPILRSGEIEKQVLIALSEARDKKGISPSSELVRIKNEKRKGRTARSGRRTDA